MKAAKQAAMVVGVVVSLGAGPWRAWSADGFVKPTAEELAMKSLPGYPDAPAVVLFREEITKDDLHVVLHYDRIKVLTEEGKKYANVQLSYFTMIDAGENHFYDDKSVGDIMERTIHPDGTIIPFTGHPYLKVMEKDKEAKLQSMVFTLPDVEVGSIIEYRYATRYNDHAFEAPNWYIQGELYLKQAHYVWYPTSKELVNSKEQFIQTITWFPLLPEGAQVQRHDLARTDHSSSQPMQFFDLTIKDIAPQAREDHMPPIASYSYRVLFNFTAEHTAAEWWKQQGKDWSKRADSFAAPTSDLRAATQAVVAGAATDDEKLKKIYAAVMALENTRYTRVRDQREDKAEGERIKTAVDVLTHKRGAPYQLTELFVGMARAAGFKAYLMLVPDRSSNLFIPSWLSMRQLDDTIAIVNVGGKEMFFDPGWRYESYGHLAWEHTLVRGMRETDSGTDFGQTVGESYKENRTARIADLQMDAEGKITGKITVTYQGSAAVSWRHRSLRGDAESLNHALQRSLEDEIPKSLEIKVAGVKNLEDYEKPLEVSYTVSGTLGTPTGKRLLLPMDLFTAGTPATFPHEKREQAVYFPYPLFMQDAQRIKYPKSLAPEGVPPADKFKYQDVEAYSVAVTVDATSFTTHRDRVQSETVVPVKDYPALRQYYAQFESKDKESVVMKADAAAAGTEQDEQ
jgi:hypothetical protein